jgi:hypothetical protein
MSACEHCWSMSRMLGIEYHDQLNRAERDKAPYTLVANAFGIPRDVVLHASQMHWQMRATREQVADWLEAQGW